MGFYSEHIFPKLLDFLIRHPVLNPMRAEMLTEVNGNILEIGIGTGLNLDFYPPAVLEIHAIDPSPGMQRELSKKCLQKKIKVHFRQTGAEELPYPEDNFDFVISTLTLCSVRDLKSTLKEIKRVLKPGGKFIFLDHGLSPDPFVARLQNFLNPVQKVVACGCQLNVDIENEIQQAEFKILSLKKDYLPLSPKVTGYVYRGIASI